MRQLLLLALALPALAQPLPLAWPDRPQGTVLYALTPHRFDGSVLPVGDNQLVLAWCDMRDGYGRVMLQKTSALDPAGGGAWRSEVEDLGPVEALAGPPAAITPFSPVLAPDGEGGAFVLWQEMVDEGSGALLLQRAGDGPDGAGTFHWPASLVIAPQTPIPYDDCRDASARCRSASDYYRAVCSDRAGGAWVLWRDVQDLPFLQHVSAGGELDEDFPAGGLALPDMNGSFRLLADASGAAIVVCRHWMDDHSILLVLGVRADGNWLLPEVSRVLSSETASIYDFSAATDGAGRVFVAWVDGQGGPRVVRAQRLDGLLADEWEPGGTQVGTSTAFTIHAGVTGAAGDRYYLAYEQGNWPEAQFLDEEGRPLLSPPASLHIFPDDSPEYLSGVSEDGEGIVYAVEHGGVPSVQRLAADGGQLWAAETTRLTGADHSGWVWWLGINPAGETLVAWSDYGGERQRVRLNRRGPDGADLNVEAATVVLEQTPRYGTLACLANGGGDPLLAWERGDSLFAQSLRQVDGRRRWGFQERPLGPGVSYGGSAGCQGIPAGPGGWIVNQGLLTVSGANTSYLQQVDGDGQAVVPRRPVFPGLIELPGFWGENRVRLIENGDRRYVASEHWVDTGTDLRLQCLDEAGEPLWGALGVPVFPVQVGTRHILDLMAAPGGGVDVLWGEQSGVEFHAYLQRFNPAGEPAWTTYNGRGRRFLPETLPWQSRGVLRPLPGDGRLVMIRGSDSQLGLQAFDADGTTLWTRVLSSPLTDRADAALDELGRPWVSWIGQLETGGPCLSVERLLPDGQAEQAWSLPLGNVWDFGPWTLVRGEESVAVVLLASRPDGANGSHVWGWRLEDGLPQPEPQFSAPLLQAGVPVYNTALAPAPGGDVWVLWQDQRGVYMSYGQQARLQRLDVLDANTAVDGPAPLSPDGIFLGRNQPNPFNPETWITFELAQAGPARLEVFNLAGQRVRLLQDSPLPAGSHRLRFDGRDEAGRELGSGLYFYRLSTGDASRTQRMLLVR